jgi:hypothetical protein
MDHIIYTTLNAFRESWPDVDTSVWEILAGRIRELLLCPECHEPIFTNPQQKNITILTDRRMIHSICLECPTTKTEERNDASQIKASQDTKPSNHNFDMIEVPIIKEQEVLEHISYPENSALHSNSQNDPPLETSSIENDLILDSEIKQQTQDITNLQDVCSIEGVPGPDISSEKAPLEDRKMDAFLDEEYKKKVSNEIRQRNREKKLRDLDLPATSDISSSESSTNSHPIPNNPVLSEQNAKIKAPEIDIQPLIQELLIEPSEEDSVKVVNVEESGQSPAIELAHLYVKTKFAEIRTIRAKQDEIMSWYCYRKYFEKRHSEILPGILKNGLVTNKKAYELASGQIYDEMLQYLSGVSRVNLRKRTQLTKPIYILFSEIGEDKIMRIKSYSANKLSKLTDMQIDTIKNHLTTQREKNSRTHVTSEMITTTAPPSLGRSEKIVNASQTIPAFSQPNDSPEMISSDILKKMYHLHPNLIQPMATPIFATRYWINILIYIENVVVKISTIMGLPMRHHAGTTSAHYAN